MPSTLQKQLESRRLLRWAFAAASGAMFAFAFADWNFTALAFVAIGPLACAIVAARGVRESFGLGWIAATVTWLINVPWVIQVMQLHGGIPLPVGVALWIAMAAYLGVYGGWFGLLVRLARPGEVAGSWLFVPLAWAVAEFARSHLLSGFPWNLTAETVVDFPLVMLDRIVGPYAVGAMVVTPGAILAWLVMRKSGRIEKVAALLSLVAFLVVWGAASVWLYAREEKAIADDSPRRVALVQPDISQEMRWSGAMLTTIFDRMKSMTDDAIDRGASVVIWPESTVPLDYESTPFYRDWVEETSRKAGIDIVLGSVAVDPANPDRIWNSAYLVENGRTVGRYDKVRLVPWGEYVPMRKMLFFAKKLVKEVGEFSAGSTVAPLAGKFRYGLAICYEIVFPDLARRQVVEGSDLLVTITNDGWFGDSAAPRQHLNGARLRAVETGRWLVRAATTGISAVVDPTGTIDDSLAVGRRGVIYADVAPRHSMTPYVRFGDWFAIAAILVIGVAIVFRKGWSA